MTPRLLTDAAGRVWRVHDYQIIAGKTTRLPLGKGQRRGFEPVDGGARRTLLLVETDRQRGTSDEVMLEQLAASRLFFADDPVQAARWGKQPERVDP